MPGVIGTVQRRGSTQTAALFERLIAPMRRGPRLQSETLCERTGQWAIGRVHLGHLQPGAQLSDGGGVHVIFHGDLHNERELRQSIGCATCADGASAIVSALYRREGPKAAARLKGAYCAVIVDEVNGQIVLINDLLGSYPMYWFHGPERFTFASELRAVLRDPAAPRALDPRAIADYLQFGFVLGNRTLAESVHLVPSASTLTYRWTDGSCEIQQYRRLADLFHPIDATATERLERLDAAFRTAVARTQSGGHHVGLALSGGLDTRAILSAADTTSGVTTYTLGVRGCADQIIADKLARTVGTRHRFFELDDRYLADFLPNMTRMVSLTDGMYMSHGLTEMLALRFLEDVDSPVLLRGHGAELAKLSLAWPLQTDPRVRQMRSTEELIPYLLGRINYIGHGTLLGELFHEDWYAGMKDGPRASLAASIEHVPLSPSDLCAYLYLEEHHRRFTIPSLELFRNVLEVRLPFVDEDFLRELFGAPTASREGIDIHRRLIGKKLLRVRNSNTGAPAGAGPLVETVLDKFNTLFKRMNVYGFRHYHNFDGWMKQQLVESVETILLDATTLDRGMLREGALRRVIAEAKSGAADHGYLLQVLLIIELWQRDTLS